MIQELFSWLDAQRITYIPVDTEVVDIPGFGRLFTADLSGVESIFRGDGDKLVFNLMESPDVLMEEGIFHVAFPFGRNWYYYDLREEFRFNLLKYIGRPKPPVHDVPFVNLGIHTSYELLNACCSPEDLCRKAKWLGHTAVGICDRNTMAATLNLQKECANTGLKHIFGYSLTMMHEEERVGLKIYALCIKEELISKNLVKDPVVTVEFMNLTVSVLGEVANPGRFNIDKDRLTLLDALSMAGDLTVYGKRENVLVQREENGKKTLYRVNLNSGYDLYASPVYYLQQNDIVYVEPNSVRARQSTVNGNNVRSTSFWLSLASLLTTITVLIVK